MFGKSFYFSVENVNLYHQLKSNNIYPNISMYFIRICINIHLHEKNPNPDEFYFSKNVTPPSYRNKIPLLYDKYLQFGCFCFFIENMSS